MQYADCNPTFDHHFICVHFTNFHNLHLQCQARVQLVHECLLDVIPQSKETYLHALMYIHFRCHCSV